MAGSDVRFASCVFLCHHTLPTLVSLERYCDVQVGSVIIALNGPSEQSVGQITEFQKLFLSPGFLVYGSILIVAALVIIFYFAPR